VLRTAAGRTGVVMIAGVLGVALAGGLSGCQGTTSPAPTAVRSTDLTSSDGGFDRHAVIGVLLRPGSTVAGRFGDALTEAGFRPDVRVAAEQDTAASQRQAMHALVRSGAKALLVEADDASALASEVQYAHDAGVVVVAIGDPLPGASDPGDGGVTADYRIPATSSESRLVERAVSTVESLQRGEKPKL
jgi:ABC-type sugar transport system substrate-binding protein